MSTFIKASDADGVRTITIDRPDVHNAFNEVIIQELTAAMHDASSDATVRVVIFASTGKSFSAGADIHWMKRMIDYSVKENMADAREMAGMLRAIRGCAKPVIARVHGACFGGGVGLVAACDLSVAVVDATFALTEVKLGILPAVISPYVQERIGTGHMRRYALTAERFDATEARRIGLISEVAADTEELDERIAFFVKLFKKNGPEALGVCKELLRVIQPVDWDEATTETTRMIAERRVSAEGQDGLKSFLEKRKPSWVSGGDKG